MKLSQAIREGKKFGDFRSAYQERGGCRTCAIGGALKAALGCENVNDLSHMVMDKCEQVWPEIAKIEIPCPLHGTEHSDGTYDCSQEGGYEELGKDAKGSPFRIASHLYSDHNWSKDEVAKWIEETVEKAV
jgi:hypothetical protein